MSDDAEAEGIPVLACGVLRDTTGRILLVHIGHDAGGAPLWWLPGAHVPPARSATETLRAFLTGDLGIHRPRIRGQHVISCDPSPAEPAGQLLILFDCATIDPAQLDRRRLHHDAFVHDMCWAGIEHARTVLPRVEFLALTFALTHRPAGLYRHLPATPAAVLPGPPPRDNQLPQDTPVLPGTSHLMPKISDARTPPALPRRQPRTPSPAAPPGEHRGQIDWFDSGAPQ